MISFTVYGTPVPKGSTTPYPIMKDGKPVLSKTGRPVVVTQNANPKTKDWQRLVSLSAQEHRPEKLFDGPVEVALLFYLYRPQSVSEKKRPMPTVKPDLDKLIRAILDGLKGKIYSEDARVCKVQASKHYGDPPRVEIVVSEIDLKVYLVVENEEKADQLTLKDFEEEEGAKQ